MEEKRLTCHEDSFESLKKEQESFLWTIKNKEEKNGKIYVTFVRDPEVACYKEIKDLENKYYDYSKILPIWPMIVTTLLIVVGLTAILVCYLVNKDNTELKNLVLLVAGIPSLVLMIVAFVYSAFRLKSIKKYYLENADNRLKILEEARKLIDEKGH